MAFFERFSSKVSHIKPLFPYIALFFSLGVVVWLYLENKRQSAQIVELLSRTSAKGGERDPYIAGAVKNRILKGYSEIHQCYKAYLEKNPSRKEGKIKVDWQISTSGKVISPEVVFSDFLDEKTFQNCVLEIIKNWDFPPPLVQKYVEHTFVFQEKKEDKNK